MPNLSNRICLARVPVLWQASLWLVGMLGVALGLGLGPSAHAQQGPLLLEAQLGLGGRYKIGCWTPLSIQLKGGSEPLLVTPRVRVPDGDGQVTELVDRPLELGAGQERTVEMLVRIGQLDATVSVELLSETGRSVARADYHPHTNDPRRRIEVGDAATARHLLAVGRNDLGLKLIPQEGVANKDLVDEHLLRLESVERLPRHYLAYEGIHTILVTTSDRTPWMTMREDDPRIRALAEWVDLGGRLILFCGRNSGEVLGSDGVLRGFLPARFVGMETLTDFRQLEIYSGSNEPFPGRAQAQLSVPHLTDVRGDIELTVTQGEIKLPLVIRARQGLGQVVLAAFDPDLPDFNKWTSRPGVLSRLVALQDESLGAEHEDYYYNYAGDLTENLQNAMERQLETAGVTTPPFLWIVGLVLLYIAIIGPGDYLLVRYVLKRMEWTWVTFPLIVVLTSAGAYWLANRLKGDELITTQVELVDVDTTRGLVRGSLWTHLFSPRPDSYTLSPVARLPEGTELPTDSEVIAWLGKPTMGIGGMNTPALGSMLGGSDYAWSRHLDTMEGVPIEVWSTRTFVSRWHGQGEIDVTGDLSRTAAQGVVGTVTNRSGADLTDVVLVYRDYVWKLGNLPQGGSATIEPPSLATRANAPRKIRTWFEEEYRLSAGDQAYIRAQRLSEMPLVGLVQVMMFSEAAGGRKLTGVWNRYQQFVDLSHALDSDSAMLVGRLAEPRSELVRRVDGLTGSGEPTSMRGERDYAAVIYRFILPVEPMASASK